METQCGMKYCYPALPPNVLWVEKKGFLLAPSPLLGLFLFLLLLLSSLLLFGSLFNSSAQFGVTAMQFDSFGPLSPKVPT